MSDEFDDATIAEEPADESGDIDPASPDAWKSRSVDFSSFVLSLATNAVVNLQGEATDDRIPGGRVNLQVAAQHIDILAMLQEKTKNNLSTEETALMQSILYDLRMQYVQAAQEHPPSPAKKKK